MNFHDLNVLRDINGEEFDTLEDCYFPPVLDSRATEAAKLLTIEDALKAYNAFREIYLDINKSSYSLLKEALFYSKENFTWFNTFYITVRNKFKKYIKESYVPPIKPEKELKHSLKAGAFIYLPFFILPDSKGKYVTYTENFTTKNYEEFYQMRRYQPYTETGRIEYKLLEKTGTRPPIEDLYRIIYVRAAHEAQDFLHGYPSWYQLPLVVFEKYVENINKRLRICYENEEFRYFIAGASDNWQEIFDVPIEMDDVVFALLFD